MPTGTEEYLQNITLLGLRKQLSMPLQQQNFLLQPEKLENSSALHIQYWLFNLKRYNRSDLGYFGCMYILRESQ